MFYESILKGIKIAKEQEDTLATWSLEHLRFGMGCGETMHCACTTSCCEGKN